MKQRFPMPRESLWIVAGLLAASCLAPGVALAQGENCGAPIVIPALPYVDFRTTCFYAHDYSEACPAGDTSPDAVYSYTPSVDQCVNVRLCESFVGFDFKLYVYSSTTGGCVAGAAIACNDNGCAPHPQILGLALQSLVTYWFVVDWSSGNNCGTYKFEMTPCEALDVDYNRAISQVYFEPGTLPGTKRIVVAWSAQADSTPVPLDLDCDIGIRIDGNPAQVLPQDLFFERPPVDFPCDEPPCEHRVCGGYTLFGKETAAYCFFLRGIPGVLKDDCICSGFFQVVSNDFTISPGQHVLAALHPTGSGVPEQYTGDDTFEVVCCQPTDVNPVAPATWGLIKSTFR